LADGSLLERAGLPAVSICTDPFALTARAMAKAYGFPGFEYVSIPHPVASLSEAQIQARVHDMLPDLLRPHELDQATQGTPAKYTFCIAENEEESPWPPLHTEFGLAAPDSAVTAMVIRSCVHIEARHTRVPEQLATDIAGTISRTGALIHETISAAVVLSPEHAAVQRDRMGQVRPRGRSRSGASRRVPPRRREPGPRSRTR